MSTAAKKIGMRKSRFIQSTVLYLTLAILGLVFMYPFVFTLAGSVTTQLAFEQSGFLPKISDFFGNLKNYYLIFYAEGLTVSLIWTLLRLVMYFLITSFTSVMGGYVFAKLKFPGKRGMFLFLLSGMMIPGVAMLVPNYIWMTKFPLFGGNDILGRGGSGLIENPVFMFITGWVSIYYIFLCRQAFLTLDNVLGESAEIDGAGFFRIIFQIYMPLIRPILAVILINTAIGMWNDYMTCYMYLPNTREWHTIGTLIAQTINDFTSELRYGGADYPKAMAVAVITMIPPIAVYAALQKQFVEGLALGGVKG